MSAGVGCLRRRTNAVAKSECTEVLFWIGDRKPDNDTRLLLVRAKIESQNERD